MKVRFKTILFSAMSTMIAFVSVCYTSCTPDKCKAIVCANGGACNDGACLCPSGYVGTQCETVDRTLFTGVYTVFERGTEVGAAQYTLSIGNGPTVTDVVITNFNNSITAPVNAYVSGDSLYIPTQTVNGKIITGNASLTQSLNYAQNATLTVYYEVVDSATQAVNDYGYIPSDNSSPSIWNKD
jgi:hypothetical protein